MKAVLLLACVAPVMWLAQTVVLKLHGLPVRLRIDSGDAPRSVRLIGRIVTQASLASVILVYPLMCGESVRAYYASLLPVNSAMHFGQGVAASVLFLCVLFGVWVVTDCIRIEVHQARRRWVRRLVLLLPTALFGAFVEELLFRGVVMRDLLHEMPRLPVLAIGVSVVVFAAAHYVRPVKRRWTFPGHLMLGLLLCVAFYETGNLWLAAGFHAGGILMIMGTRPFFRYRGPAWITGASTFPFAGVVGLLGLVVLTVFVASRYGGGGLQ